MNGLTPRLEILPPSQRRLWPELQALPDWFVLYGGTSLALRLAHRESVDFDFFTHRAFVPADLLRALAFLEGAEIRQGQPNTLTVSVDRDGPVFLSFFGGLDAGRVVEPDRATGHGLRIASLLDVGAMKAAVIQERAEKKDYLDIAAILDAGISLEEMLGAARAVFGPAFNPAVTLKALCWFEDGDVKELDEAMKQLLATAAEQVTDIPRIARCAEELGAI